MFFDENNNYFIDLTNNDGNIINFNRNLKLYSVEEGFNKGNMFENLYSKYKNHVYKLKVNDKKDELLYKIQMYSFALKDLTLYLDIYPTDDNMINEFNKYKNELVSLTNEYEEKYGPLESTNSSMNGKWDWINNPWPWDKGGN